MFYFSKHIGRTVCFNFINHFSPLLILGTHEAQTCEANNCSTGGRVNISCTFAENSQAKGYLSILCPKTNSSQEMFVVANRPDTSTSDVNISVPRLPPDDYTVVVYDLGSSGLPVLSDASNPYVLAAEEENVTVTNPGDAGGNTEIVFTLRYTCIHMRCTTVKISARWVIALVYYKKQMLF